MENRRVQKEQAGHSMGIKYRCEQFAHSASFVVGGREAMT